MHASANANCKYSIQLIYLVLEEIINLFGGIIHWVCIILAFTALSMTSNIIKEVVDDNN